MPEAGSGELQRIQRCWEALQPALALEQCGGCECLQGALAELLLALEELPEVPDRLRLSELIRAARASKDLHGCLGCVPCNPGDLLAGFYRAQATGGCNWGESCTVPAADS